MGKEYKGYNGTLILTDNSLIIKRGVRGVLLGGGFLRGDKTIPYSSIVAVQLKRAGLFAGYLQFTLKGGSESKSGLVQSLFDENSINFHGKKNTEKFNEAKMIIENKIFSPNMTNNNANELEKYAELRDKGIITNEEFESKKQKILNN